MQLTIVLPLPHRGLRPNSMLRWQAKFGLTKQARERAKRAMFEAAKQIEAEVWVIKSYHLYPFYKTKRHWDDDNLTSSFKGGRDGIAEAAGQDDKTFKCTGVTSATDTKNPRLEIVLEIEEII